MVKNVTSSAEQALSGSKKECLHLLVWLAGVYSKQLALFHGFHCNLSHLRHCATVLNQLSQELEQPPLCLLPNLRN